MDRKELLKLYFNEYKKSYLGKSSALHSVMRKLERDSSKESFNTIYSGLSLVLNSSDKQVEKSITDGINDYSIDAIFIPSSDTIYPNIAVFDFKGNGSLDYEEIKKFIGYVEIYILEGGSLPIDGNKELTERLKELHKYLTANHEAKIDIIIYREGLINRTLSNSEENKLQYLKLKYERIGNIRIIGFNDILELVANKLWYEGNIYSNNYTDFNLNYIESDFIKPDDNLMIGVVTLFDLLQFIKRVDDYNTKCNSGNRKYDIFSLNVRKKVDKSKSIREGIIKTVENSPEKFLSYNNGITITCENFSVFGSSINFKQPQIVNGCQTISGLFDHFSSSIRDYNNIISLLECNFRSKDGIIQCIRDIEKLKKSKIYIKIVIAEQLSEEPKLISHYANSQTEVTYRDLVSNNLEQLIISNYLRINGFNYFRKDGQEFDRDKKVVSISQVYKFMYSYILLDPSKGKNDMRTVFEDESIYNKLFPSLFSLDDIVKIGTLYESVNKFKKRNNINQYYVDHLVFGLFLIYKEAGIETMVQPNTIKLILDEVLEAKSGKKISTFGSYEFMRYFQRLPGSILNQLFIEKLERKYKFTLDRSKFEDFINSIKKRRIEERNERMKKIIFLKNYSLDKLNAYLKEKEESGRKFKNVIWIIQDIVSENNGTITKDDLITILNRFHKYTIFYIDGIILKNNDKIIEKDGYLFIKE